MSQFSREALKLQFQNGDVPYESDYINVFDSYYNKIDDKLVFTVNGVSADNTGNIPLSSLTEGIVYSVNSVSADVNGNVNLEIPTIPEGIVYSVNSVSADVNGNIDIVTSPPILDLNSNLTLYAMGVSATGNDQNIYISTTNTISFNPSTGTLSASNYVLTPVYTLTITAADGVGTPGNPYIFGTNGEKELRLDIDTDVVTENIHIKVNSSLDLGHYRIQPWTAPNYDILLEIDNLLQSYGTTNFTNPSITGTGYALWFNDGKVYEFEITDTRDNGKAFVKKNTYSTYENTMYKGGYKQQNGYIDRYTLSDQDYYNLINGKIGFTTTISGNGTKVINGINNLAPDGIDSIYNQTIIIGSDCSTYVNRIILNNDFADYSRVRFIDSTPYPAIIEIPAGHYLRDPQINSLGNFTENPSALEAAVNNAPPGQIGRASCRERV